MSTSQPPSAGPAGPAASSEPAGKPGRYQRSAAGLTVSLLVTVAALGVLLWFMGAFRPDFQIEPEEVDYLQTVEAAQSGGLTPVYPPALPEGWIATGVDVVNGSGDSGDAAFMVRLLTDEQRFVGVRMEDASPLTLVRQWVDEDAVEAEGHTVPAVVADPVAREWEGYADEGGDTAYVAEVGDTTVMVFGSAPPADLQTIVDGLVATPLG